MSVAEDESVANSRHGGIAAGQRCYGVNELLGVLARYVKDAAHHVVAVGRSDDVEHRPTSQDL